MIRSVKYRLYPNNTKIKIIQDLTTEFVETVNSYVELFVKDGLPKYRTNCYRAYEVQSKLPTKRLIDNAACVAWDQTKSYLSGPRKQPPRYDGGLRLNAKNASIKQLENTFDGWIYIQPLRLHVPFKEFNNKWRGGKLLKDFVILEKHNKWFVKISYESQPISNNSSKITSVDVGLKKSITTPFSSFGKFRKTYTRVLNRIRDLRSKLNKLGLCTSKRLEKLEVKLSALLKQQHGEAINEWLQQEKPKQVVVEDLNIKNTKGRCSKKINHEVSRIGISGLKKKIAQKCEELGIGLTKVNPAYTSQTCPNCSHRDKGNRNLEVFRCKSCGFTANADQVGAINILKRFQGAKVVLIKGGKLNSSPEAAHRIPLEEIGRETLEFLSRNFKLQTHQNVQFCIGLG
jgi:putative transposase